ncbi:hypothetical protein, partial [Alloalcanivorax venustensis]|uniref:hypothetical protein n=1 Tax=Alloalcanivorax venustensis TaxID=172371 RepID=UPI003C3E2621
MLLLRHAGQHLPLPVLFFLTLFALAGCGGGGSCCFECCCGCHCGWCARGGVDAAMLLLLSMLFFWLLSLWMLLLPLLLLSPFRHCRRR